MASEKEAIGCPFLAMERSSSTNRLAAESAPPRQEKHEALPISDIITRIVHEHLGLPEIDCSPYIAILEKNLIVNSQILLQINPNLLARLQLPLAIENALVRMIESGHPALNSRGIPMRRRLKKKQQIEQSKSALLGISDEMRRAIKESWALISAKPADNTFTGESNLTKFFDLFYKNFLEMDKTARRLFEGASMIKQAQALMKIMTIIMQALDNPTKLIRPLRKLGVRHLIYGVERKNFQSWAISLVTTIDAILGERCSSSTKEAWYVLIQTLGDIMMEEYDEIRAGYQGRLYKKEGNKWKLYYTLLTHETLTLYKDETYTKVKETFDLSVLDSMDLEEGEKAGNTPKYNNYCFSVSARGLTTYFCAESEEDLVAWVEDLTQRIKAHQRLNRYVDDPSKLSSGSDDSESSLDASSESSRVGKGKIIAARKVRRLQTVTKKKFK